MTATSSRRLPGGLANRAMAAIDGDPDTWWSPGFLAQQGEFVDYASAQPVTVQRLDLTVLDGRHSVPLIAAGSVGDGDDLESQVVVLPPIADQARDNGSTTVTVRLPQPREVDTCGSPAPDDRAAVRDVKTLDWFTGKPLLRPIGLVDLGIAGLQAPAVPARVDGACLMDLLEVEGESCR